jgi:hypothetical protein
VESGDSHSSRQGHHAREYHYRAPAGKVLHGYHTAWLTRFSSVSLGAPSYFLVGQLFSLFLHAWDTYFLHDRTSNSVFLWISRGWARVSYFFRHVMSYIEMTCMLVQPCGCFGIRCLLLFVHQRPRLFTSSLCTSCKSSKYVMFLVVRHYL